jgi:hypothetical protein
MFVYRSSFSDFRGLAVSERFYLWVLKGFLFVNKNLVVWCVDVLAVLVGLIIFITTIVLIFLVDIIYYIVIVGYCV